MFYSTIYLPLGLLCVDMLTMEPMNNGDRRIIVCVQEGSSVAGHNESQVVGIQTRATLLLKSAFMLLCGSKILFNYGNYVQFCGCKLQHTA